MALSWRKGSGDRPDDEHGEEEAQVYQFPAGGDLDDEAIEQANYAVDAEIIDSTDDDRDGTAVALRADTEIVERPTAAVQPWAPGTTGRRVAERVSRPLVLPPAHVKAAALWWGATLGRGLLWHLLHPWVIVGNELRPLAQGTRVTWRAWREWVTVADLGDIAAALPKEQASLGKIALEREQSRSRRRKLSFIVTVIAIIAGVVAYIWWTTYLILAAAGLVVLVDVIGRRNPDPDAAPPPKRRTMLEEGAPLGSLTSTIIERFTEDGLRVEAAGRMRVHAGGEYRLEINHEDAVEPKHLRSLERHLGALNMSVRCIGTERGGISELRLPTRDHLAEVAEREWAETGSRSIVDPAPLWFRSDGERSAPCLSAVHVDLVGTTGAGKSEATQEFISFFGECRDVYPVFIDLTRGPLGPLNKRVLRRHAYSVEEAAALLDWALEKIEERHMILHRLAESDDPDAPIEWDLKWGPEIKIIIDEYSFVAVNNGKDGTVDLHGRVEAGMRVGRKVKVTYMRASQRSGNADLGSTVAQALVGLKILMACTERDTTTMLSTGHRDRGWTPHEFRPAVKGDARDAGKCFVWGPGHRDPEIHRFHQPRRPGEIKMIDRRRDEDGLPNLDGTPPGERPAVVLTPVQVAVEEIFTEYDRKWLPTNGVLLPELAARGFEIDSMQLADELANKGSRGDWEGHQVRGYRWHDVQLALGLIQE
jgi:hypothetical protein